LSAYTSAVDFKEVTTESEGDGAKYGSNQQREIMKIFNGEVVATRLVQIANPWRFIDTFEILNIAEPAVATAGNVRIFSDVVDGKLKVKKPSGVVLSLEEQPGTAATHKTQHVLGGGDVFVKTDILPAVARYIEELGSDATIDSGRMFIVGTDLKYWDDATTPIKHILERQTNKNAVNGYAGLDGTSKISSGQIPTLGDSNIATHTTTKITINNKALLHTQIAYKDDINWLTSAMVSTARLADKTKLHSAILYNDQNNDFGAFYHDIGQIAVPANPASGKRRLFVDTATGKLSVKTSAGVTVDLESVGTPPVATVLPDASSPPTSGKWGAFWGGAFDGTGMMAGVKNYGTAEGLFSSTTTYTNYKSPASDDEQGGFLTNNGITRLDKNPYVKFVIKTPITTERFWAGICGTNELDSGQDYPIEDIDGVMFGYSDIDANWTVIRNNAAATPIVAASATAKSTSAVTVEMIFVNAGTSLTVKLNGATILTTTTTVPGSPATGWNLGAITESIGGTVAEMHVGYMYITATA
jgi:hypothetical protein